MLFVVLGAGVNNPQQVMQMRRDLNTRVVAH